MAQIKSQIKRIQTNELARQRNVAQRSRIATQSKKVRVAVENKDVETAKAELKVAVRLIDKSVSDGVYARNTANRKKSSLIKLVNSLAK